MLNLNFEPFPLLATGRLVLKQVTPGDAREIFMLRSSEEVNKFIERPKAIDVDEARQFIHKINEMVTKSEGVYWGIYLKDDPKLIGTICYWNISEAKQCAEIGYELDPAFQGKGMMQEAIQKVIHFGFETMRLEVITAFPRCDNIKSRRLLEKNNFSRDENLEREIDDLNNYVIYSLPKPS